MAWIYGKVYVLRIAAVRNFQKLGFFHETCLQMGPNSFSDLYLFNFLNYGILNCMNHNALKLVLKLLLKKWSVSSLIHLLPGRANSLP